MLLSTEHILTTHAGSLPRQRQIGIDVISDGELGKVGFSNYVLQRMSGFEGQAEFMAADFMDAPAGQVVS